MITLWGGYYQSQCTDWVTEAGGVNLLKARQCLNRRVGIQIQVSYFQTLGPLGNTTKFPLYFPSQICPVPIFRQVLIYVWGS